MGATESGVFAFARESGIELEVGSSMPWLSNQGHLNPVLAASVPRGTLQILAALYRRLGGDESALASKRPGGGLRPDFILRGPSLVVEVDEVQHFTSDRLLTLDVYPKGAQIAFDIDEYRRLAGRWSQIADRYRAAKPAVDFPHPGGRRAQRAYFDALRDLVAPSVGWKVLRVPAPECDPVIASARLANQLAELA